MNGILRFKKSIYLAFFLVCIHTPAMAWNYADWADDFFNGGSRQAREKVQQQEYDKENLARESCKTAIRRSIRDPASLRFDSLGGMYSSYKTEGGFAISISGSTSDGRFDVTCYTDQSYRVTSIK